MNFWVAQGGYETDPSMRDTSRCPGHPMNQIASAACFSSSYALLERIQADESLPALARELFAAQAKEYAQLQAQIDEVDARLMAWHRADECSPRLTKIPGVGPIVAVRLTMKTPQPELFRSGRHFAAWIGLAPEDQSTAGKVRITRSTARAR